MIAEGLQMRGSDPWYFALDLSLSRWGLGKMRRWSTFGVFAPDRYRTDRILPVALPGMFKAVVDE
jgi:hypothetical protein